jgi:hypothetical protein
MLQHLDPGKSLMRQVMIEKQFSMIRREEDKRVLSFLCNKEIREEHAHGT